MLGKPNCYVAKVGIFLITVALIAGMVGCGPDIPPPEALEIWDWYDLDAIRDNLGGSYILMNDLDSTTAGYEELASPTANQGKGWQPIGSFWSSYGLTGTFDGQGYEIRDLFINRPDEGCVGLFVIVDAGGRIENIGVVNATVTGYAYVCGLVGGNEGTVSNSYSTGNMIGEEFVSGLVGFNGEVGTVSNSYSSANVTGYEFVGGLVGGNEGIMSNSYSTGSVTGDLSIGGLVGENRGTVSDSYSTGSVTGYSNVGGLVGWNEDGTVSNSFWDTETSGQATSAGGTGKNTTEMKSIVTFSGAGWNIIAVAPGPTNTAYIWNIVNGLTYPFLSWEP
jgi:hypothetical protein